jgi:hypothetical protein
MIRGRVYKAAAVTAMAILMVWPGTAASASDEARWQGAECATGQLSHAEDDGFGVVVFGSAQLCPDTDPGDGRFAVATFSAAGAPGVINERGLRHYAEEQDQPFGVSVGWQSRFGVCLLASPTRRIACAEITTDPAGWVGFRLIAPTDPLVAAPVDDVIEPDQFPRPCNSCF